MTNGSRALAPETTEALRLLGELVRLSRGRRRMTESELAERVGIARSTLQKIERGDPGVRVGLVLEAATMAGVPLFDANEAGALAERRERVRDKLALLPRSVRSPAPPFDDDF